MRRLAKILALPRVAAKRVAEFASRLRAAYREVSEIPWTPGHPPRCRCEECNSRKRDDEAASAQEW